MSDFLFQLECFCTEKLAPPSDWDYQSRQKKRDDMEKKIVDELGVKFLNEYTGAFYDSTEWELTAHFREGLRFGLKLALEVLAE